ncbi:MAG TPA: UDP-N-acetylmuramoyl-tripeptide--D-alanyl-D-alanine ligase [Accumulibacter sp.]|uniref:UDP-N-acetylmuramoyl-tripeptide--D-alanyl-D- alanine ligase n=1 Tax=Accumulibacter sp. TaxID=2053492 RepID=UPI0025EAA3CF|nr:UDP-N-acetylmuramoyl-tripeptide--D-alanyl-D-alanine ligase [Accumulibacter sp.]MCM8599679.1 UDP-N-acetylmuramoyl-tripeptide--D-alanyl-D-alanine ligase [Accumulibacter sp.]MCM8663338.1 UDP-N-acetylmuramoyl-tripeptide--D-alanyl-D-alanine ligase [Accumulibacter sp.]HNC50688.1 UDP-N-acetylmuramoyl-tripeptide--D-alanyl-D-alanine ligase [Accumulibacter sp.]
MSVQMDVLAATRATAGKLVGDNAMFCGVSTDSRTIAPGELFIALRGEHFDGHAYLAAAKARGAVAAIVAADAGECVSVGDFPLVQVADTRLSLGALAADWRSRFTLSLIAVTGSNGKTTTKEMIASILRAAFGEAVLATRGNYNNDIGLPLTLLRLNATHRAAIVEMGMNHPGEIAYLAGIARPTVAVITNAQRAHLAGMGSLEAIAREKGSIFTGLDEQGIAVINADDSWAGLWQTQSRGLEVMTFGCEQRADVTGKVHRHGLESRLGVSAPGGEFEVVLALPGEHNARNALAAATACLAAGVPIAAVQAGLTRFRGLKGRLQQRAAVHGAVLLDDTYNANPDSVRAGIDVLAATIGKKIIVLGDMGEIGDMTAQFHDEIGGYAKSQGIDRLFALGEASALAARNFGAGGEHYAQVERLIDALCAELTPGTTVLVKGSRFMRMERVADAICAPVPAEGD